MRPIALTFSGLRSYRHRAHIDFTDLDCFAIIGDTGAGKSTVLEALSIALYGQKTWTSNETNQIDLIADGADQMTVEFVFAAGGGTWTVTRVWKRSTAPNINKLVGPDDEKYDGKDVTIKIRELTGLDHDQFTRAVVLPQGRFDELLRQTPSARNRTLKTLLGAGELTAVTRAARHAKEQWRDQTMAAETARKALPADPKADLATAERALAEIRATVETLNKAITTADAHQNILDEANGVIDELTKPLVIVSDWDSTPTVEALVGLAAEATEEQCRVDRLTSDRDTAKRSTTEHEAAAKKLLGPFDSRDTAVTVVGSLRHTASRLSTLTGTALDAHTKVEQLTATPPSPSVDPDIERRLNAARAAHDQTNRQAEQAVAAAAEAIRLRDAANQAAKEAAHRAEDAALTAPEAEANTAAVDEATAALDRAEEALLTAKEQLAVASAQHHAATAAEASNIGDPCPICARQLPDSWTPPVSGPLDAAQETLAAAEEAVTAAHDQHTNAKTKHAAAETAASVAATEASTAASTARQQRQEAQEAGVDWAADIPTASVELTAEEAADAAAEAEQVATKVQAELDDADAQAKVEHAAWQAKLEAAGEAAAMADSARTDALLASNDVPEPWQPKANSSAAWSQAADQIDTMLADHKEASEVARSAATTTTRLDDELTQLTDTVLGSIVGPAGRHIDKLSQWCNTATSLDHSASIPALPPVDRVSDVGHAVDIVAAAVSATEPIIATAKTRLGSANQTAHEAQAAVLDALSNTEAETIGNARELRAAANERRRTAEETLAAATTTSTEAELIDDYLAAARPYLAALEVIGATLADSRFVDHLIGSRERELLTEASRRLRAISNEAHAFTDDFSVINISSGEARPAEALSGGERFQASLALALALVEIASRGGGQLEAIFVDEGFGSLDTDSLDTALDTLLTIAGTGKQVGLISHLRPVAAAVEDVFYVHKDPTTGSQIEHLDLEQRDTLLTDDTSHLM